MQELDDIDLLREYVDHASEDAFSTLVARHINKVYSVALRHTRNPQQAEEITQTVFVILAKKSRSLGSGVILSGWLYETARLTAVSFTRSEIRRARREQEAHMEAVLNQSKPDLWPQIAPLLDVAMAGLSEIDRHAVVLRFLDGRSMQEVGAALGASEDTAGKRVNRAVDKLRDFFTKRGIVIQATVLAAAISANSVQAAPVGLAKTISVVAIAQGATAGVSIMAFIKGLLKPIFTLSVGTAAAFTPLLGSVFFHLKAEIENTKSTRERQFIVRMIWFRFTIALLFTAVPIAIGVMFPSILKQPGVLEFGFAGFCFCGAIESGARFVYFHRRRRQIQIEDGTWEEFDRDDTGKSVGLLADLSDKTSKANCYSAIAAVFGLVGCILVAITLIMRLMSGGHWIASLLIVLWCGSASFRWIRNWRQRPRLIFDARFATLAKFVCCFGVLTLLLLNFSWARGRLPQSDLGAIGCNFAVVVAYATLIGVLARLHRGQPSINGRLHRSS